MQIVQKKLTELKPYEKNPRKTEHAVESVANSIKEFGFKVPIIIDKNNVIVAGHTRYQASKKLGLKEVPCIIADDLTEEQIKAFRIADNKTGELSTWDNVLLKDELGDILDDFDMTQFGFGDFELTILTGDFEPEPYDEGVIKQYSDHEAEFLARKRIIITYEDNQVDDICSLLGLASLDKVVYTIEELM